MKPTALRLIFALSGNCSVGALGFSSDVRPLVFRMRFAEMVTEERALEHKQVELAFPGNDEKFWIRCVVR